MAKLQINYTNISQSVRLLKMGVPAWSSDCTQEKDQGGSFWQHKWIKHEWNNDYDAKDYQKFLNREKDSFPCWSVGRLMEIFDICFSIKEEWPTTTDMTKTSGSVIEYLVTTFEIQPPCKLDFSKLELNN